jgi:nifR3 family TIM-barrel protein
MTLTQTDPRLHIGNVAVDVPVVLAPMAGITNTAFRQLCREYGAGLYVCEMITSRALVERVPKTMRMIQHHASEKPRSIQLYGVDPQTVADAIRILVGEDRADHIDLNFGCPVPKVTKKGGGAALPWKQDLFRAIVTAAVHAAGDVPVTIKMRKGIDADHLTFLDAAKAAEDAGVSAIALHGRTQNQHYSGLADWDAIRQLKEAVTSVPVLGNGDIWSADDAISMVQETGCDGVVVGRGCLGRPWLFGDLDRAFRARAGEISWEEARRDIAQPPLGEVMDAVARHTELLVDFFDSEDHACRDIRKHMSWYFKGYGVGSDVRRQLATVESLDDMHRVFETLDRHLPYPGADAEGPRGRAGHPKRPHLPEGWLDSRTCDTIDFDELALAEREDSGG